MQFQTISRLLLLYYLLITVPQSLCKLPQSVDLNPLILAEKQSIQIPLLPYLSSPNTEFTLSGNPPNYVSVIQSIQSNTSTSINNPPENIIAAYASSEYVVFVNQSSYLLYGTPQDIIAGSNLTSIVLNTPNTSDWASITSTDQYIIVLCGYKNSKSLTEQTLFIFDTVSKNLQNIPKVSPTGSTQTHLTATNAPNGPLASLYNTFEGSQFNDFMINIVNISSLETHLTHLIDVWSYNLTIKSLQMNPLEIYIINESGSILSASYNQSNIGSLSLLTSVQAQIRGSCESQEEIFSATLAVFSNNTFYYVEDSSISNIFTLPTGLESISCILDSEFLHAIAQNTTDNTTQLLTFALSQPPTDTPIVQMTANLNSFRSGSTSGNSGSVAILSDDSFWTVDVAIPTLSISNVQDSINFTLENEDKTTSIPINAIVYQQTTPRVSQKIQAIPNITNIDLSEVSLNSLFVGPALGVLDPDTGFFGGVYGPCSRLDLSLAPLLRNFFMKVHASSEYIIKKSVKSTFAYTNGAKLVYSKVNATDFYSADRLNIQPTCTPNFVLYPPTIYDLKDEPTKCLYGEGFDICLVQSQLVHISGAQGIIFTSNQTCEEIYLWSNSAYGQDVSICINNNSITFFNQGGDILATISPSDVSVDSFLPLPVTTHSSFPDMVVVLYDKGILGLQLPLSENGLALGLSPKSRFNLNKVDVSKNCFIQLALNRLVLIQFEQNSILEWDITNVQAPYYTGSYLVDPFTLLLITAPVYEPIPNHLSLLGDNGSDTYLLTFQPGNPIPSVLIYATNVTDLTKSTFTYSLSSSYDATTDRSLFIFASDTVLSYFYAASSPSVPLPVPESDPVNPCFFCSGQTTLQVSSSLYQLENISIDLTYTVVNVQQKIQAIQDNNLKVSLEQPYSKLPADLFTGTVLDYKLADLVVNDKDLTEKLLELHSPLNRSITLKQASTMEDLHEEKLEAFNADYLKGQVDVFGDESVVYILYEDTLFSINPQDSTKIVNETAAPANVTFITGDWDVLGQNALVAAKAIAYKGAESWGVYLYPNDYYAEVQAEILKVKLFNSTFFALTTQGISFQTWPGNPLQNVIILGLVPVDFDVTVLDQDLYGLVVVDNTNTLHNIVINAKTGVVENNTITGLTELISKDLQSEPLKFVGVQAVNRTLADPNNTSRDFILYVQNFHSYQVMITYQQNYTAQIEAVNYCFVQLAGHQSQGNIVSADNFFFDIKKRGEVYYIFSYPYNNTYTISDSEPAGDYKYVKPVERKELKHVKPDNMRQIQGLSLNGENSKLFIAVGDTNITNQDSSRDDNSVFMNLESNSGVMKRNTRGATSYSSVENRRLGSIIMTDEGEDDNNDIGLAVLVFNTSRYLEVKFNGVLTTSVISDFKLDTTTLTLGSDIYYDEVYIGLDKPIDFLDSAYFIIFTVVFTLIFIIACVWFFRRAYAKRKIHTAPEMYDNLPQETFTN